jgi:hypothetical protein
LGHYNFKLEISPNSIIQQPTVTCILSIGT